MSDANVGLPQFDVTTFPTQVVYLAITFTILYFWISKVCIPSIESAFKKRNEYTKTNEDAACVFEANTKKLLKQADEDYSKAKMENNEVIGRYKAELVNAYQKACAMEMAKTRDELLRYQAEVAIRATEVRENFDDRTLSQKLLDGIFG